MAKSLKGKKSKRALIQAEPNPVPASDALSTTTISWSTGDSSPGWVFVHDTDGNEQLFAKAARGDQIAPWIASGATYRFTLYGDERRSRPLASVNVAMERGQVGPLLGGQPARNRTPVADGRRSISVQAQTRFDRRVSTVVTNRIQAAPLLSRHCRGGTQVLPIADGHLCLVHESVSFSDGSRVYLHRWVWFDCHWRLAKISRPFFFQEPGIEFAGGLARRGDQFVVSYGVRDRDAWLATVDVTEVLSLLASPLDGTAERRLMDAEAAGLSSPLTIPATSSENAPEAEAQYSAWWGPTFLKTVDAYKRGDLSQGLAACERLLSVDNLPPAIELQTRRNATFYAPSLAEVAPSFSTRAITFPVRERWTRFNPSVAADADGNLRMVVRSSNYEFTGHPRYVIHDEQKVTRTTNYLLDFDANLTLTSAQAIEDRAFRTDPPPLRTTGFEDCRLISRDGSWWLSATVWDHTPGDKSQIALLRLEDAVVAEMHLLTDGITRIEKNWMPVQPVGGSELYFVYTCFPTVLVKLDEVSES